MRTCASDNQAYSGKPRMLWDRGRVTTRGRSLATTRKSPRCSDSRTSEAGLANKDVGLLRLAENKAGRLLTLSENVLTLIANCSQTSVCAQWGWCQTLFLVLTVGMVSDFVLGSYVLSSKPKTKSDPQ